MARPLRYIPEPDTLVEVTGRTVQSRLLLKPSPAVNERIVGVLGRAQRLYPLEVCAAVVMGSHWHLLLVVDEAKSLSEFMRYANSNVAREVGRLVDWRQKFWGDRYRAICVSREPAAQIGRLAYVLSHGVKESLVERVTQWPGVHAAKALLEGKPLEGYWFDRTKEYNALRRGQEIGHYDFATKETLELSPLPCWRHLDPEEYRERIAEIVERAEAEAAAERERSGKTVLGVRRIRRQHPHQTPGKTKRSPAPRVHAASKKVRKEFWEAYRWFTMAFREAAKRLREGDPEPGFPEGSFPPAMPFVPSPLARPP